jgi:hypothetical protein
MPSPHGMPPDAPMEFLIEILLEFFGETLLQLVFQVLAEVGMHSFHGMRDHDGTRPAVDPWLAGVGYLLLGTVAGGISLWIKPDLFLASSTLRLLNLVATPLAAGLVTVALGAWRRRRDQALIRLDRFVYGFIFAFGMGATRYIVAG